MQQVVADGVTHHYLHAPGVDIPAGLFDPDWLSREGRLLSDSALGRGTVWLFAHSGGEYALRHYRRGGAMAKLSDDSYVWLGLEASRAAREYHLLLRLAEWGLPVPRPLAAHIARRGGRYRNDIITARIPDAQTLAERVTKSLGDRLWMRLGSVLRRFHDAGVYHADLNANNILIDAGGRPWLIDFDKGAFRKGERWKAETLSRLRRSLDKLAGKAGEAGQPFHFDESKWQALLAGYVDSLD